MKITRLEVENFKRLKAVTIEPDGSLVVVGGRNGQGKSSTLDAIEAALGGMRRTPEEPIRRGATKARVVVETDDMTITRHFGPAGSRLEVEAKGGGVYRSPQHMLDKLMSGLSFDPLEFSRLDARQQAEMLRQVLGLDFGEQDRKRKQAFDERTQVNRDTKRLRAQLGAMPQPTTSETEEISVSALSAELDRRRQVNRANADQRNELTRLSNHIAALQAQLAQLSREEQSLRNTVERLTDLEAEEIEIQISKADLTNQQIRESVKAAHVQAELAQALAVAEGYSGTIDELDRARHDALSCAIYPVDGLRLTGDGVELNGLPFAQASQAEKLRTSVAIGLAQQPDLKVLLVRDGSLLDEANLALVAGLASEAGAQVWIETVSIERGKCTVIIEDGAIKEPGS